MAFHCVRCHAEIEKSFKACPNCGEPVTDFLRRYTEEPVDGKYEILERLGAGGMGEVYKVRHKYLGSLRVIKVIRAQISDSREAHDRFLREARVATRVQHPNVATLHDFSALPDGSMYMVWEFIDGENVAQRQRAHGTLPPREAVRITIEALYGLDAIHRAGIVHRDISPENIMVTRDEQGGEHVKIIDLGVAKSDEPNEEATRTGMFLGKFRYSSPEHVGFLEQGEKIDGRADLYSLAIVLYEMLAGRPPFEATSPHEYIILHARETQFKPIDLAPDLPGGQALQDVLKRALERDRNKRFATAREFAAALVEVEKSLANATPSAAFLDETIRLKPGARGTLFRTTDRDDLPPAEPTVRTPLPADVPPPISDTKAFEYTIPPAWQKRREEAAGAQPLYTPPPAPLPPPAQPPPPPPPAPTPQPAPILGQQTVIDPYARPQKRSSALPVLAAIFVVFAIAGVLAFFWWRNSQPTQQVASNATTTAPTTAAVTTQSSQPPSQTAIDVVTDTTPTITPTSSDPTLSTTAVGAVRQNPPPVTATVAPPPPRVVQQPRTETVEETADEPEAEPEEPARIRAYVEGGDSDDNETLLAQAQSALRGTSRIAVRGRGNPMLTARLENLLREHVTIDDSADVRIDFFAKLEHLGRGRKRRIANAIVTKNGRPVFHYQLAGEYRVGDDPAEAFARVMAEALGR